MTRSDRHGARRPEAPRRIGAGWRRIAAAGLPLMLAACLAPTPEVPQRFDFGAQYSGAPGRGAVLLDNVAWWKGLRDPRFEALVDRALAGNLDIRQAAERVTEARAAARAAMPATTLTPSASAGVQTTDAGTDSVQGQISLAWLLDPWGGRRAQSRAAEARAAAAGEDLAAARLILLDNLGSAYIDLRYRQRLLALGEEGLRRRRDILSTTRVLADRNSATRIETSRAAARVAGQEGAMPGLRAAAAAARARVTVLAGDPPGRPAIDPGTGPLPRPAFAPETGIPADLLRNRPDIRAAERRYAAAVAEIDATRAAQYPTLSLSGTISLNALQGGSRGASYYLGPALSFPALPPGIGRARVAAQHARARQAHLAWRQTVLGALLEVETALLDYRAATEALNGAERAYRLYAESLSLQREVFDAGEVTVGDLITAEEELAGAEETLATRTRDQAQAFVALNVRLGAGNAVGTAPLRVAAAE